MALISQDFYLGKFEVTQQQWSAVMGTNPWAGQAKVTTGSRFPAVYVSWDDAQAFVAALNDAAGDVLYRLPTEAEWEYACRAGTDTDYSFGDDPSILGDYAWFVENTVDVGLTSAQEVGLKMPNAWGLHDMHGNVDEWCQDWYGPYAAVAQIDPQGPVTGGQRVKRGRYFSGQALYMRSATRSNTAPSWRAAEIGLRLVRVR